MKRYLLIAVLAGIIIGSTATHAFQALSRDDLEWINAINTWTVAAVTVHGQSDDPQIQAVTLWTVYNSYQVIQTMATLTDYEDRKKDLQRMARIHLREWGYHIGADGNIARLPTEG